MAPAKAVTSKGIILFMALFLFTADASFLGSRETSPKDVLASTIFLAYARWTSAPTEL
jgi:hypothetical protein